MTHQLLRRASAVIAAMVLVLAVAGPAFANVAKWGTISCPSRPTYLHATWKGEGWLIPPWHYMETLYHYTYYSGWRVATGLPGEYDGGSWYAEGSDDLNTSQTYVYCS
jgi:hypothetical protein